VTWNSASDIEAGRRRTTAFNFGAWLAGVGAEADAELGAVAVGAAAAALGLCLILN